MFDLHDHTAYLVKYRDVNSGDITEEVIRARHIVDIWRSRGEDPDSSFIYETIDSGMWHYLNAYTDWRVSTIQKGGSE